MSKINFYSFILVVPAIIFSFKLILEEAANMLAISDYAEQLKWINQLIRKITRSEIKTEQIAG